MVIQILKRQRRLVGSILCSLLFTTFYLQTFTGNFKSAVYEFQESFLHLEKKLENSLYAKSQELKRADIKDLWSRNKVSDPINVHIYRNDSLIYWNTNQLPIIRFAEIHFPSEGIVHLQNGWYYAKITEQGGFSICASFLIKNDYSYENKELKNSFAPYLNLSFDGHISLDQEQGFPIYSKDKAFIFSLVPNTFQSANRQESITLMILLLAALIFWLTWLNNVRSKWENKFKWIIPVAVIVLRFLSLHFGWFDFMSSTTAFDPSLYGTSYWFPNLFAFFLNIAIYIYIIGELRAFISGKSDIRYGKLMSVLLFVLSIFIWVFLIYLIKGLIENSSIPLIIDKLFALDLFSIFSIASIGVFFYFYFLLLKDIVIFCKNNKTQGSHLAVIGFIVSFTYFLYEINIGNQLILASIFPFFLYGYTIFQVYRNNAGNQLASGLILLTLFSIVTSVNLGEFNRRKELGERELYANQLAAEKSIVTEVEYSNVVKSLKDDHFLLKFISDPRFISVSDFQEIMERRFFNGFWERYEMDFSLFDRKHLPLIDNRKGDTSHYRELQQIVERSGIPSEIDSNVFFINDYTNQYSYIIRQELVSKDSSYGILFCTLKSKKIPEEIGFPRLLISSEANVFESLESYSIAKYYDNRLITQYGNFSYSSNPEVIIPKNIQTKGFFNYGGFNHYVLKKSNEDIIILSSKNFTYVELITSFSYLFSFFGLLMLPLVFKVNSRKALGSTFSLALKIQIVLIGLVFLSLLAFGWGSGIFVRTQYNQYTNDVIREKLNSVETECRAKLGNYDNLSIVDNGDYMQYVLQKFAKVFFTDINFYDPQGYILATSRPKVFNLGLISEQIHPVAYKNLILESKSEFVHHENIGALNYSSAYMPFYNNSGELLGFINLQHFGQQREFENQIQKFLVAIINVFILLLAISIILAIFISNWVTSPLRLLQESFAGVKFGKLNERISYDKNDEIGSLVKDYNQKLEELEFTAQQLAKSERESAWREMAKQVAHEIKNPLTPMKLSVQQLLRTYDPKDEKSGEKLKKVAASIIEQIDALSNIANEFSTFAKMPFPSEEKIELVGLIKSIKEVFELEGQTEININSSQAEIFVYADKDQFVRVFNNLIKNAIQAIPEERDGFIEISLTTNSNQVHIAIKDNGVGIDPKMVGKIFVPYFTTKSTGTGLGLAMVKQIIENHKGQIDFESNNGNGTTFFITLPLSH